jgi:hypothetical protein
MSFNRTLVICLVFCATMGCVRNAKRGEGVLPGPPANLPLSRDTARSAFAPLQAGAFSRMLYRNVDAPTFTLEVREVEIAPRTTADRMTFRGAALIEIRGGAGRISSAAQDVALVLGSLIAVPDGEPLSIRNDSAEPLSLRVYLVASK